MFQSYQPNVENLKEYLNNNQERGDGPRWWSIPSGMSSVRILPPWDPTGRIALPVYMHPIEYKAEGSQYTKYNWTCNNKTFGKTCQICEGLASLAEAGVDISNYEANRRQFYFNAIVMHDPTYNEAKGSGTAPGTHVLMKAPKTFYDWLISQITNPMIGDVSSITNGIDIFITKEGTGLGTTYNMTLSPNGRTPIPQEYLEKITNLYNLDDIFSSGFDQEQINGMVNSLKKSAGVMNNVGSTVNQMAGYTTAQNPNPMMAQYQQYAQSQTSHSMSMNQAPQMPQIPTMNQTSVTPPQSPYTVPQVPVAPPQPTFNQMPQQAPAAPTQGNLPKCFGQYDPGSVNCVVCPSELQCSKSRG